MALAHARDSGFFALRMALCRFGLECLCRDLRKAYRDVLVFSGPLWLPYDAAEKLPSVRVAADSISDEGRPEPVSFVCVR